MSIQFHQPLTVYSENGIAKWGYNFQVIFLSKRKKKKNYNDFFIFLKRKRKKALLSGPFFLTQHDIHYFSCAHEYVFHFNAEPNVAVIKY